MSVHLAILMPACITALYSEIEGLIPLVNSVSMQSMARIMKGRFSEPLEKKRVASLRAYPASVNERNERNTNK